MRQPRKPRTRREHSVRKSKQLEGALWVRHGRTHRLYVGDRKVAVLVEPPEAFRHNFDFVWALDQAEGKAYGRAQSLQAAKLAVVTVHSVIMEEFLAGEEARERERECQQARTG